MSFEEAKQILQMEDNGTSLYDHLSQVRLSAAWAAGQAHRFVNSSCGMLAGVAGGKASAFVRPQSSFG